MSELIEISESIDSVMSESISEPSWLYCFAPLAAKQGMHRIMLGVNNSVMLQVAYPVFSALRQPQPGAQLDVLLGDDGVAKDPVADEV